MSSRNIKSRVQRANPAVDLVMRMMAIPGKSGEELEIQQFIRSHLLQAGIDESRITVDSAHTKSRHGGETGNLIVKLPGTVREPRRLLMAHIDTVPICVGSKPIRRGGFVHSADARTGLGGDNRAGAAVVLNTILEIQRCGLPHPPLTLFWPVQEEVGLVGARFVARGKLGRPQLCFNWDGGAPNMAVIGATGAIYMDIHVQGVASHAGAHPENGVSAIAIAGLAIAELTEAGWHGLIRKGKQSGTSNIGVISGGSATNVVVNEVLARVEARSHKPAFRRRITEEFRKAFERAAKKVRNTAGECGSIRFESEQKYESFRLKKTEPCVREALSAVAECGCEPRTRIVNGGLDANWMSAHGFPTVSLGCGQADIHTINETLHIESFLQACRIAVRLATVPH